MSTGLEEEIEALGWRVARLNTANKENVATIVETIDRLAAAIDRHSAAQLKAIELIARSIGRRAK